MGIRNQAGIRGGTNNCRDREFQNFKTAPVERTDLRFAFVSGPLHAGNFGPNPTDNTFGIDVRFQTAGKGLKGNRPPSDGHQYFGGVELDAATRRLTVTQRDHGGDVAYSITLDPAS